MAKKLKIKLPKRIGGVKIPKSIRKGPIAAFVNSGAGQVLLAEALLFAAGAITAKQSDRDGSIAGLLRDSAEKVKAGGNVTEHMAEGARHRVARNSERFQHAFAEGLRAFRAALDEPHPSSSAAAAEDSDEKPAAQAHPKKKTSREIPTSLTQQ